MPEKGVNVGTAWVQLVFSAKGSAGDIENEIKQPFKNVQSEVSKSGEEAADGFFGGFKSKASAAAGTAGILAGGLLTKGFLDSVSREQASDKLAAQLGLSEEQSAAFGKTAGKLYAGNFGGSFEEVNDALRSVQQNLGDSMGNSDNALETTTGKVLNLASTFDQDLNRVTAAAGTLIKTGLVKDSNEAFDIITRGFQTGADKGEDLLDTFIEYPTVLKGLGLSAAEATGVLSQGLAAGARNSDVVADALKEFQIRAQDGSKATAEGFAALGLDVGEFQFKVAAGGDTAKEALGTVLDRLRGIEDPVQRNAAAVALFGTKAEDLGQSLFALDPKTAVSALGEVTGAADKMGTTLTDNTANALEVFKRNLENKLAGVGQALGPILSVAPGIAGVVTVAGGLGPALGKAASGALSLGKGMLSLGASLVGVVASGAKIAIQTAAQTAAFVAQKAVTLAVSAATKAYTAIQWLFNAALAANPITLVVLAIAALVAGIIYAYNNFEGFRNVVDAVFNAISTAFNWVKDNWPLILAILTGPFGVAALLIVKHWDTIRDAVTGAVSWILDKLAGLGNFIKELPGKILDWLGGLGGILLDKGKELIQGFINGIIAYYVFLGSTLGGLIFKVVEWIGNTANWLYDKGIGLIQGFINGITGMFYWISTTLYSIASNVPIWIGDTAQTLFNKGVDLIQGFINGIWNKAGDIISTIKNAVTDKIPGFIKNVFDIGSPSKVMMRLGEQIGEGLELGIGKSSDGVQMAMSDLVGSIRPSIPLSVNRDFSSLGNQIGTKSIVLNQVNNTNADPNEIAKATAFELAVNGVT